MITYTSELVPQEVFDKFICDRCKKELTNEDQFELQEICTINFTGGYSSVFGDGYEIEIHLCQDCLFDLTKDFYRCINCIEE